MGALEVELPCLPTNRPTSQQTDMRVHRKVTLSIRGAFKDIKINFFLCFRSIYTIYIYVYIFLSIYKYIYKSTKCKHAVLITFLIECSRCFAVSQIV